MESQITIDAEIGGGTYKFKVVFMEECPSNSLTVL